MEQDPMLEEIVRRITATVQPERIVLFGSRARGDARPGSDYDLLVIRQSAEPRHRRAVPLYAALADLPIEVDLMVYTPEEVREWSGVRQAFVTTALRQGRTLCERQS